MSPLRTRPPVELAVAAVQLVELRREARTYRGESVHEVPLNAGSRP
ncbi:hypothetical protein ACFY7Y_33600 [Streptomyces virginiae]|nr:hypothetical protein [Streptomyces sp. NBC_00239]WSX96994.1 hypothetical protein OG590_06885 [Streptomyces goshikiensis]